MTAGEELRQAITRVALRWGAPIYDKAEELADAVLAVPAIADALARDAHVAEILSMPVHPQQRLRRIAALYPEAAK